VVFVLFSETTFSVSLCTSPEISLSTHLPPHPQQRGFAAATVLQACRRDSAPKWSGFVSIYDPSLALFTPTTFWAWEQKLAMVGLSKEQRRHWSGYCIENRVNHFSPTQAIDANKMENPNLGIAILGNFYCIGSITMPPLWPI
jgi:hypothetical protein